MTVSTFFPDADPETTSVDGMVAQGTDNQTWATKHDATIGDEAPSANAEDAAQISAGTTSPLWLRIRRLFFLFDTSAIPDGDTIDSATMEFVGIGRDTTLGGAESIRLVPSTPATNTNLITDDYDQETGVAQATDLTLAGLTVDSATYNAFTLNATGLAAISKTGVTKFGIRCVKDADNVEPAWVTGNAANRITMAMAEEILAGDKRPKLVVTHTGPPLVPRAMVY